MDILSREELDARISTVRPLTEIAKKVDDSLTSSWPIAFPESGTPGTRISLMQAKVITANLTIRVLEVEKAQLLEELQKEQARGVVQGRYHAEEREKWFQMQNERNHAVWKLNRLKAKLRKPRKKVPLNAAAKRGTAKQ
jgi:predicted Fe-S protein YdhL (DUF1289 family)